MDRELVAVQILLHIVVQILDLLIPQIGGSVELALGKGNGLLAAGWGLGGAAGQQSGQDQQS